jgi:uncharacterized membrane protein
MGIIFGLLSALAYGTGDFMAGLGSRRIGAVLVAVIVQFFSLVAVLITVLIFRGNGPTAHALLWGAVSGVGSGIGTYALYEGLAVGQMSVVAPLSAIFAAVVPVFVGLMLGDHLSALAAVGIGIAVPAIGMVSWQGNTTESSNLRAGIGEGVLSGFGFALLYIGLDQAGTQSGAWPLVPTQAVAIIILVPFVWQVRHRFQHWTSGTALIIAAGLLSGAANLLFLAATGRGQLSIIAVLTSLYPAITILLARIILDERWSRLQIAGLIIAAVAVVFIGMG